MSGWFQRFMGLTWFQLGARLRPHFRIRTEDSRKESVFLEGGLRAALVPGFIAHTLDAGSRFPDEGNPVEQVGNQDIFNATFVGIAAPQCGIAAPQCGIFNYMTSHYSQPCFSRCSMANHLALRPIPLLPGS